MRRWIIVLISIVVSAVFLWLALRDVPINEVVAGIQQADFGWIVMSIFGVIGALATRAERWRGLLDNRIPLMRAFHILNVTMLLNNCRCARAKWRVPCWRPVPACRLSPPRRASLSSG